MVARIILFIGVLMSFFADYLIISGTKELVMIIICEVILTLFKVITSIWIYKDSIGWDKFENSEGLSLKRKK